jgi:hypothetical protein
LSSNYQIKGSGLKNLNRLNLIDLNLQNTELKYGEYEKLLENLKGMDKLKNLDVSDRSLSDTEIEQLKAALPHLSIKS